MIYLVKPQTYFSSISRKNKILKILLLPGNRGKIGLWFDKIDRLYLAKNYGIVISTTERHSIFICRLLAVLFQNRESNYPRGGPSGPVVLDSWTSKNRF